MTDSNGAMNGAPNEQAVAEVLQDEVTLGYRPVLPLEALWASGGDMPTITLRRDLEFMQMHPVVAIALEYYRSGIAGAEFWGGPDHANPDNDQGKPISPDPRVAEFVMAHVERYWQRGMPMMQEAYAYGWAPGEHIYKDQNGMMVWSHLKDFHPNDSFILTEKFNPIGIRIKNIRNKPPMDLWFASQQIPAKAAWYPHRPRFTQFYGRSQLIGAWRPWRRLGTRDALEQIIDAACFRAGYRGPIVKYPPGNSAPTATQGAASTRLDGGGLARRENRDVARQIGEYAKAGATFAISSEQYSQAQGGGPKWEVEFPDHVMDVGPLINAAGYLEDQIMLGIGVPPELVKAGGTGSGYSGRSIPREAFLDQQQRIADAMLQHFVEQVVKPLVLWNFGDVPFEISCKPLLSSQAENKQGGVEEPLPQPNPQEQQAPPQPGAAPPPQAAMSQEAMSAKVQSIIRSVLRRVG